MGNHTGTCPQGNDEKNDIIANFCTDAGASSPAVTNMCILGPRPGRDYGSNNAALWLQSIGGIGGNPSTSNDPKTSSTPYNNPEYNSNISLNNTTCTTNGQPDLDGDSGYNQDTICSGTDGDGYVPFGLKQANYGDPLQCCLRDFQCNEAQNNDIHGASCFSDNSGTNTCPQSFRATDTIPCQFLTTQYCLGNIGDTIDPTTDLDFVALWVNSTAELVSGIAPNETFKIYSLPIGYQYKLDDNWYGIYNNNNYNNIVYPKTSNSNTIPSNLIGKCELDPNTGLPLDNSVSNISSCPRNATVSIINPVIPFNTDSSFNFQGLPPCQSIFWRTLYGNEPKFQNQYWTTDTTQDCPPDPVTGEALAACETSSNAPQGAACSASPFTGIPTTSGVDWAKTTLKAVVDKIKATTNESLLTPSNLQGNAPFFSWMYSVCSSYPYLCQDILTDECSTVTTELLDNSPGVRNWCGCYLPSKFYDQYTNDFINQECTPYCNSSSVIPMSQPDGTAGQYCSQSVCIIDDVAINLAKTEFEGNGGSINFNQMCGSCGSNYQNSLSSTNYSNKNNIQSGSTTTKNGSQSATIAKNTSQLDSTLINDIADITCQCRINNFTLTSLGGSFVGGINLAQSCGGNSKCYGSQTDPITGNTTSSEVDCSNSAAAIDQNVQNLKASLAKKAETTTNFWTVLIVLIVFAFIIIIWLFFITRGVPEKDLTFSRNVINSNQPTRNLVYKGPIMRR